MPKGIRRFSVTLTEEQGCRKDALRKPSGDTYTWEEVVMLGVHYAENVMREYRNAKANETGLQHE